MKDASKRRCACYGCNFHHTEEMFGADSVCLYCALAHRGGPHQGEVITDACHERIFVLANVYERTLS